MNTTREKLVHAALRYLLDHLGEHVTVEILAASCGVAPRTLQLAFKDTLGTSPKLWITKLRLRKAREILLHGDDADTVTFAAHDSGFSHLGRFSQLYRKEFGELPSLTLLQAQELARLDRMELNPPRRLTSTVTLKDRRTLSAQEKIKAFSKSIKALKRRSDDHSQWARVHQLLHDQLGYKRGAFILKRSSDEKPFIYSHCRHGMGDKSFRLDMHRVNNVLGSARGVVRSVLNSGESRLVDNVWQAPEYAALDHKIRAELCVPVVHNSETIGAVNFESEHHDLFDRQDLSLARDLAGVAAEQLNDIRMSGSLGLTDGI